MANEGGNLLTAIAVASDMELLDRTQRGDQEAYGQLVARHQAAVCAVAYSLVGDVARSEDVAQEAFITAWQHLAELRDAGRFKPWLCGIARNMALALLRSHRKCRSLDTADMSTMQPSPEDQAVSNEELALVWNTLESLPQTYREPLVLFYREELSVARVAEALELSIDAVKQRLSRGREMLRDEIAAKVEKVLRRTGPGTVFTLAVLGALPGIGAATASAAAIGAASKIATPLAAASIKAGLASGLLAAIDVVSAPLVAWMAWRNYRYHRERPLEHGWEMELACPSCGAMELPVFHGLSPNAIGFGKTPAIFANLNCAKCGTDLKRAAESKLVELFSSVRMPKGNRRLIIGFVALAVAMVAAMAFGLLFPGFLAPMLAVVSGLGTLCPIYLLWFTWQIAALRHHCDCGNPAYKLMGALGRSGCYRCSSCSRLLRLRD